MHVHDRSYNTLHRISAGISPSSLLRSHMDDSSGNLLILDQRHLHTGSKPSAPRTSAAAAAAATAIKNYKARVVEVFDGQAASNDPDPMQDAVGAILLRFADLKKDESVLDIGTGGLWNALKWDSHTYYLLEDNAVLKTITMIDSVVRSFLHKSSYLPLSLRDCVRSESKLT